MQSLRQNTKVQSCDNAVSLAGPFGQDKPFGTFSPNDGPKNAKYQEWQRRRESVDDETLHTGNGGDLRVGEQNP